MIYDKHAPTFPSMQLQSKLKIEAGMASVPGPNESNEDCLGVRVPDDEQLVTKGVAAVIADGVSAAEAGKQAAEICVQGFLNDYYDAPEAWTVKTCGTKIAVSLNRWLHSLGQSHTSDGRGYVTTFSSIVFKGESAYLFHVGDTRIYRLRKGDFEQLTRDHSFRLGKDKTGLARAMGMDTRVDVDVRDVPVEAGDRYLLTSDGIHGFLEAKDLQAAVSSTKGNEAEDFDAVCLELTEKALAAGSNDNCSAVLIEVKTTGMASTDEHNRHFKRLPFPPDLAPGMSMDGYEVMKELQATSRSQTYLVQEIETGRKMVMKTPSVNFEEDTAYIERFVMEAWIGKKLKSDRLAASFNPIHGQKFMYTLLEYIDGVEFADWMKANPLPEVRKVTGFAIQILQGLRAMHRQEMLHQDMKPSNVIIHPERGAVIIDYGSTRVAGLQEIETPFERENALGTLGYSAPEYFLGRKATRKSDLFSLGVVIYEALTGKMPYGEDYEKCQNERDFLRLKYQPTTRINSLVPVWLDGAIRKAVSINPQSRYDSYSEFEYDLEHPNTKLISDDSSPFLERNPVLFWKIAAGILAVTQVVTLAWILRQ